MCNKKNTSVYCFVFQSHETMSVCLLVNQTKMKKQCCVFSEGHWQPQPLVPVEEVFVILNWC